MVGTTIPHEVHYKLGAAKVLLKPAVPGNRGHQRQLDARRGRGRRHPRHPHQVAGTDNPINVVRATIAALASMRTLRDVAELRGQDAGADGRHASAPPRCSAGRRAGRNPGRRGGGAVSTAARDLSQEQDRLRQGPEGDAGRARAAQAQPQRRARRPHSSIRGMVHKVRHLVSVDGEPADSPEGVAVLSPPVPEPAHEAARAEARHRAAARSAPGSAGASRAGQGKTCGPRQKGQGSRESKQRPQGFRRRADEASMRVCPSCAASTTASATSTSVVNLSKLVRFEKDTVVDPDLLTEAGLIPRASSPVKVLAAGQLRHALTLRVHRISAAARTAVEVCGWVGRVARAAARGGRCGAGRQTSSAES